MDIEIHAKLANDCKTKNTIRIIEAGSYSAENNTIRIIEIRSYSATKSIVKIIQIKQEQ